MKWRHILVAAVLVGALGGTAEVLVLAQRNYAKQPKTPTFASIPSPPLPPKASTSVPLPTPWQNIFPIVAPSGPSTTTTSPRPAPSAVNPGAPGL